MKRAKEIIPFVAVSLLTATQLVTAADPAPPPTPPKKLWDSSAALGLTLTSGNSDTLLFNANIQATRKWDKNELDLGADGSYGETDNTRNIAQARAYAQYNRLFTDRWFGYARLDALYDEIADIAYRVAFSPGVGYYFIKETNTTFRAEVGPGVITEKQGGETDTYMTLRLAERFDHKLSDRSKIWQLAEILPQVDRFENYIVNAEIGIETAITKSLSQRTYLQDTYDNEPAPGRKANDLKLVAGLAYKF